MLQVGYSGRLTQSQQVDSNENLPLFRQRRFHVQSAEVVIPPRNIYNLQRDASQHFFHGLSFGTTA